MRPMFLAGGASAVLLTCATPALADCGEVSITEMDWASAAIVTGVATFLMEQGYGCDVTVVPSAGTPALVSVAETGKPDIVTEMWSNSIAAYEPMKAEGTITPVGKVLSDGGIHGWWVPDYLVAERPELGTLEGIKANPEVFGNRFHGCPENWGCFRHTGDLFLAFEMDAAGYEIFTHGSGETLASAIAAAYENGEPWLGYYYGPTSILGKYPMVRIDLGPVNEEAFDCARSPDCTNLTPTGYPSALVETVLTPEFAEREPAIAALMGNLTFTNDQMSHVLAWQQDEGASLPEAVVYFLTTYPEAWSTWIDDSARERLASLISQ